MRWPVVLGVCGVTAAIGCLDNDTDLSLHAVAADLHAHRACPAGPRLSADDIRERMEKEDVDVTAMLVIGPDFAEHASTFDGTDDRASRPGRIVHDDLEVSYLPAAGFGHLVVLGLSNLDIEPERILNPAPFIDWATAQGPRSIVGYAHGWAWPATGFPVPGQNCCVPFQLPVDVTFGHVAFLAEELNERNARGITTFDGGPLTVGTSSLWRRLMNSGYRLALTAGSDILCLNDTIGSPRTLAFVDGAVSYDAVLDAVRRGRTAVASRKGHRLDVTIEGARLGDELAIAEARDVQVTVVRDLAEPSPVDVLVNGVVAKTLDAGARGRDTVSVRIPASAWVTARSQRVQTSAIYVLVGGAPIRASAEDACYLVRYVDHLRALVERPTRPEAPLWTGAERRATLARYDEARAALLSRFREARGETPIDCR